MSDARFQSPPRSAAQLVRCFPGRVASGLAALLLVVLASTWRRSFKASLGGTPSNQPSGVYVLHHNNLLMGVVDACGSGYSTLISRHRDGDLATDIATWLGLRVIRGSSSRGAHGALVELERQLRSGAVVNLTGDGPRGPRSIIKPGLVAAAVRCRSRLVPVAWGADRYWEMPSWDRFRIPQPFARVRCLCGPPIALPDRSDRDAIEGCRLELEETLLGLINSLEEHMGIQLQDRACRGTAGDRRNMRGRGIRSVRAARHA